MNLFTRAIVKFLDLFSLKKYLVLGDSHTHVFRHYLFKSAFPFSLFEICDVGGATVSGLDNPNSKTNALEIFRKKLELSKKHEKIIFLIGEVDTGFVIWYRASKYGTPIDTMLDEAIDNYQNFLLEASDYGELLIISAPLPTITDDNDWGEVANLRREVKATQIERTNLTIRFNKKMEKFCNANGFDYLNLDEKSINSSGLVKSFLLNDNRNNHHYDTYSYAKLILSDIKKYIS